MVITLALDSLIPYMTPVSSSPYFSGLEPAELETIGRLMSERNADKDEIIWLAGEPANELHFLVSGAVKLFFTSCEGKEQILKLLRPGESFGDIAVFDGDFHSFSAQTIVKSVFYTIRRTDLEDLLWQNPQFARNAIKVLAEKARHYMSLVEDLSFMNVDGRLAKILLEQIGDRTNSQQFQLSRRELAAMVGTVRETVGRVLKSLEDEGIVSLDGRRILINDVGALREKVVIC